jgi:hypothetical protein
VPRHEAVVDEAAEGPTDLAVVPRHAGHARDVTVRRHPATGDAHDGTVYPFDGIARGHWGDAKRS